MYFESNGKILLSAEYLVMDGAKAIAFPSKFTQELYIEKINSNFIHWISLDKNENIWYEEKFFQKGKSINYNGGKNDISEKIVSLFNHIHLSNNISDSLGKKFISKINFNVEWGLGSSSSLVNNLAKWSKVDPYKLLFSTFKGSGYDIACCDVKTPIFFSKSGNSINVEKINFNPTFKKNIFLIYRGEKQNTQNSISDYKKIKFDKNSAINKINELTNNIISCNSLSEFEKLIETHESIISKIINIDPIQKINFRDYNKGVIKSLGSWGGDFILVTGDKKDLNYFKEKGYNTIFSISDLLYLS
tara:strand:+ start:1351 stop:2259 length:909 start_codon:yes stop_codon:yes gene_type:complete